MRPRNFGLACCVLLSFHCPSRTEAANSARPAARLEVEHGTLWQTNSYDVQVSTAERAIHFVQDRGSYSSADGVRGTLGLAIVTSRFALFPRLSVGYARGREQTALIAGELDRYRLQYRNHFSLSDAGIEFQFFDRVFLTDIGFGYSGGHARYRLLDFSQTEYSTQTSHGLLVHLGVGLRAPLRLPLGFGVKSGVDTFLWLREQTRWTMSLFAEIDPFYRSDSSE